MAAKRQVFNSLLQSQITVLIEILKKLTMSKSSPSAAAFDKYLNQASATFKALHAKAPDLLRQGFDEAVEAMAQEPKLAQAAFLRIKTTSNAPEWLFHAGLLWNPVDVVYGYSVSDALDEIKPLTMVGDQRWRLAYPSELNSFARKNGNPWRSDLGSRLFDQCYFISSNYCMDLDYDRTSSGGSKGALIAVSSSFANNLARLIDHAYLNEWLIFAVGDDTNMDLLAGLKGGQFDLDISGVFKPIDTRSAKLPALEDADFEDPNKGLWEFWGMDANGLDELGLRARNPADDVQQGMVAIDFGTSSTVVAFEKNGVGTLLRIGVTDFWEQPKSAHYENPTVLEMLDLGELLKAWQTQAYRPDVLWDEHVRCSHEALHNFRNNETNPEVVASILSKIKQWALREADGTRVRLTDQQGFEHELAPLTLRQPVKGRPLTVSDQDPFDPVELYAWFLGLTINWRGTGIFLRYYMTFPVDYPKVVKDKILASFRRGLQRSLPETLVSQSVFEQFLVEERASEPAAYAAAAMSALNIEPTEEGVAYAVFDFGGGTTDFDFGYYRLPTDTEERSGIEQVFEHFDGGGDKFLGGENLLEHLAYRTFRHNIEVCRKNKIAFTKPQDADNFSGSEMFLARTQAAATNSLMLASRLRKFWESGEETSSTGVEKIDLLDRDGKKVPCEFTIPYAELKEFLQNRIEEGIKNFFTKMEKAFAERSAGEVNVLLAGNAARSNIVLGLFGLLPEGHEMTALHERSLAIIEDVFEQVTPEFKYYPSLAADEKNINAPTGKTGVALGLLALCPGSATLVVNHARQQASGDAPFQHFVGRIRRGKFHASLHQGGAYQAWVELGPVGIDRVFKLFHTQAARALGGDMLPGDGALVLHTLEFAGETTDHQVFARPVKPHEIEICTATSLEATRSGEFENLKNVKLG